jgi:heat shock protein HslJ
MTHHRSLTVLLLVAVAALLVACAGQPAATPAPATQVAAAKEVAQVAKSTVALVNTAWQLESMGEPDSAVTIPADMIATLGFLDKRYGGFAGCDWFVGSYYVQESTIQLQTPTKTQGGCTSATEATKLQASYLTAMMTATMYAVEDGKLVLYTGDNQRLMTMIPLKSVPFEGTTWELAFYPATDANAPVAIIPGTKITATFDGQKMTGNAGCNDYSADYTRDNTSFKLGPVTATKKTCAEPKGVMEQEQAYLAALAGVAQINQFPRSVELLTSDGTPQLMYSTGTQAAQ